MNTTVVNRNPLDSRNTDHNQDHSPQIPFNDPAFEELLQIPFKGLIKDNNMALALEKLGPLPKFLLLADIAKYQHDISLAKYPFLLTKDGLALDLSRRDVIDRITDVISRIKKPESHIRPSV